MFIIKSFRFISFIEGLSFLYLLFCSIYLKRIMGDEHAIDTPGRVHGALFLLFCLSLGLCWLKKQVSFKFSVAAFIASVIPFGFLWIEHSFKKK